MLPWAHTGAPAWPNENPTDPTTATPVAGINLGGAPLSVAFFTAVSATSVTGLVVADTATYWSGFGMVILAILIEIGGLGTMTLGALMALLVAHKLNLRQRLLIASTTGNITYADIQGLVKRIVKYSAILQLFFTPFIFLGLILDGENWYTALGNSLFLSVSAFNNAGFSPYPDNLVHQGTNLLIVIPVMLLLVLGGLGFPVMLQVWSSLRQSPDRQPNWTLNTRIVLSATAVLILVGWLLIVIAEWHNPATIANAPLSEKLLLTLFTAISPRTAGFNVMDIASQSDITWLITDFLMFIGAGPAGTAGGIKVTTAVILVFIVYTEVRAGDAVQLFERRIGRSAQRQAITVVILAFVLLILATATILAQTHFRLDQVLFEVVSAMSTVGLSTGITNHLPVSSQLVLCILMFFGRIGPVTIASALALRPIRRRYEYPKERPIIG
ncbi:cation transport protein [Gleimia coleocanis DSM 15436]|uniref:Cation transport protein n=2 Tax=Gleimia TaxID=2692113 RepID=C0VYK2_9ACTO|nr:cation transport protein [Gleimia coleocanis DSM 15436]